MGNSWVTSLAHSFSFVWLQHMDALLLTVYFLVVFYVLYKMSLDLEDRLEDKVDIIVEEKTLREQTQAQISSQPGGRNIEARVRHMSFGKKSKVKRPVLVLVFDAKKTIPPTPKDLLLKQTMKMNDDLFQEYLHPKIIIRIAPTNEQPLKKIMFVSVSINNDTGDRQVYVNWDRSSLEMMGQGNRIVRSTPNVPVDLSQSQVETVVNPAMMVASNITTESRYNRNTETNLVAQAPQPVVDLKEKIELSKLTDPTIDEENVRHLYTLDLMLGIKHRSAPDSEMMTVLVPFIFNMKIKVDKPAFPPMRWWLRQVGRRRPEKGNWFWGSRPKEGRAR